jgi:hypothetical protein
MNKDFWMTKEERDSILDPALVEVAAKAGYKHAVAIRINPKIAKSWDEIDEEYREEMRESFVVEFAAVCKELRRQVAEVAPPSDSPKNA